MTDKQQQLVLEAIFIVTIQAAGATMMMAAVDHQGVALSCRNLGRKLPSNKCS